MAHASPEDLKDLQGALDKVRAWPRIAEKRPNIFYLGAKAFLHFHSDGARLWADVKRPDGGWTEVPATTKAERAKLIGQIEAAYSSLTRR